MYFEVQVENAGSELPQIEMCTSLLNEKSSHEAMYITTMSRLKVSANHKKYVEQFQQMQDDIAKVPLRQFTTNPFDIYKQGVNIRVSGSHLDLGRAPYVLYGVKYIDPVTLAPVLGNIRGFSSANCGYHQPRVQNGTLEEGMVKTADLPPPCL